MVVFSASPVTDDHAGGTLDMGRGAHSAPVQTRYTACNPPAGRRNFAVHRSELESRYLQSHNRSGDLVSQQQHRTNLSFPFLFTLF